MQKGIDWSIYLTTPKRVRRGREFIDWAQSRSVAPIQSRLLAMLVKLRREGISARPKYLRDGVLELKLEFQKNPFRLYFFAIPPDEVKFVWGGRKDRQDEDIEKAISLTKMYLKQGGKNG